MKNILTLLLIAMVIGQWSLVNGQTPQAIPYQAVARDNAGNLNASQNIPGWFTVNLGQDTVSYETFLPLI